MSKGPLSYQNWKSYQSGKEGGNLFEYPLYADVNLTGDAQEGLGPYKIFNAIPARIGDDPSAVLLVEDILLYTRIDFSKTNTDSFSGLELADEVATLISLLLRTLIISGSYTREIKKNSANLIKGDYSKPLFLKRRSFRGYAKWILPELKKDKKLSLDLLKTYPLLEEKHALAIVRSARAYREAIWIAESSPNMAWLFLVSAVEVAAASEYFKDRAPLNIFRELNEDFSSRLREIDPRAEELVANELSQLMKSQERFLSFMEKYLPDPPEQRPSTELQLNWDWKDLRRVLKIVYKYRSEALHASKPFPVSMCMPPDLISNSVYTEKPIGLAFSAMGGTWKSEDAPLNLHIFEYMVNGALIKWWKNLIEEKSLKDLK